MPPARSNRSTYKTCNRNVNTVPYEIEYVIGFIVLAVGQCPGMHRFSKQYKGDFKILGSGRVTKQLPC